MPSNMKSLNISLQNGYILIFEWEKVLEYRGWPENTTSSDRYGILGKGRKKQPRIPEVCVKGWMVG